METGGMITRLMGWIKRPFNSDMDALHWVLFLGLVLIAVFFWSRVMAHITEG